jgi:hypothetical protein
MTRRVDQSNSSLRGILLCLGLVAFGGVILLRLFLTPQAESLAAPAEATPQIPGVKLRFVSCDVNRRRLQEEPVFAEIRRLDPDYLLLQNVDSEDVAPIAEAMGMAKWYHPGVYQPSANLGGSRASWGNCVLSKQQIFEGSAIEGGGGVMGAWAVSAVDGKRFLVGSVHLKQTGDSSPESQQLISAWEKRGSEPIVIGGLFCRELAGDDLVQRGSGWFDALSAFITTDAMRRPQIFLSPGWSCIRGGVIEGFDLAPAWIDASSSAAATAPTTRSSAADDE